MSAGRVAAVALLAGGLAACNRTPTDENRKDPSTIPVELEVVAEGLDEPTYLTSPPGDPQLFVTEQPGRVRIIADGALLAAPFLDIRAKVLHEGERGLLGLAFPPDFASTRRFFVHYTGRTGGVGSTRLESYLADGDVADPASAALLLELEQPYVNHNGGQIVFGPDGMLYVGLGDGGSAGDPQNNAQNLATLLGAILRIDVSEPGAYAVPPDNPFVDRAGAAPEIWHYGLRNPWRFSFSSEPPLLLIGDVGQNEWEEIDAVPSDTGGVNFGWAVMEGNECFSTSTCSQEGLTLPAAVYRHPEGCSVTGGYVYEGTRIPELAGRYVYSDFCAGWLRTFVVDDAGGASDPVELLVEPLGSVTSLGEDADGELYVVTQEGRILRLVPKG